ncbi:Flp pilus assembly complex ATPase component TadA [Acidithiobacillus caldus ATCC 51756]|nr:ATPase, T2SS/T4P/T4SS family [Acidithiobacillus caldus]MBU2734579.1 Flp pilus assembly complex ATPase component TadA [Acidithiobacillus caldus ATCC 51756]
MPSALRLRGLKSAEIDFLLSYCHVSGADMGESVRSLGMGSSELVMQAASIRHGYPYLAPAAIDEIDPRDIAQYAPKLDENTSDIPHVPIALSEDRSALLVAINNGFRYQDTVNRIRAYDKRLQVQFCLASKKTIQNIFRREFFDTRRLFDDARAGAGEDRYNKMLEALLLHACYQGASDIHLNPLPGRAGVCYLRIDGTLETFCFLTRSDREDEMGEPGEFDRIVQAIRADTNQTDSDIIEGGLDKAIPEAVKGKFRFRVEITKAYFGNRAVVRILNLADDAAEFHDIGFDPVTEKKLLRAVRQSAGMLIVTGPTGSGKTTTINALMRTVDAMETSIQSVEKPVEIPEGLWVQHNARTHQDTSEAEEWLRWFKALMRCDPDKMFFGEIRDAETTAVALDGANTGHTVLTTMHTRSTAGAITRIRNLRRSMTGEGLDMDMVASNLLGILATRLVRKLCLHCRLPEDRREVLDAINRVHPDLADHTSYKANPDGCPACKGKGYKGRRLVYEYLDVTRKARIAISEGKSEIEIESLIPEAERLWGTALRFVALGVTAYDEIQRVILEER